MSARQGAERIVIDTNIAVSALIAKEGAPAKVFEKLIRREIENYTSKEIISELKEVLKRKEITERTSGKVRKFILREYLNNSMRVAAKRGVHAAAHDADNRFIEAALAAGAKYIITGDSHLLELREFGGVKIVRAKEFLETVAGKG